MNLKKLTRIILLVAVFILLSIVPVSAVVYNATFDSDYYLSKYEDLRNAFGNDNEAAYNHFLSNGVSEGRVASPVFDVTYYLAQHEDLRAAFGENNYVAAYNHFMEFGRFEEGRKTSPIFDVTYYLSNHPDLQAAFGANGYAAAYDHFVNNGRNEAGRMPSPNFNVEQYIANYPDLQVAFGNDYAAAYEHYLNFGISEGRTSDAKDHVHDFSTFVEYVQEPTCKVDGEAKYKCTACEETETKVIPASEEYHEWKETATDSKAATCLEDGLQNYICTICKETKSEVVPASEAYHNYGKPTVIAGQNVYECSVCHYLKKEQINCEHSYDEIRNTATCTEAGVKTSLCSKCKDVKKENVDAKGHDLDLDAESTRITVKKTCTTNGEASGICKVCKKSVVEVIPASHNYGVLGSDSTSSDRTKNATCDKDGKLTKICLDCDNVVYETIKAKGHTEPTDKTKIKYYKATYSKDATTGKVTYKKTNEELKNFTEMTKSEINEILCEYGIVKVFACQNVDNEEEHFKACKSRNVQETLYEYVGHKYVTTIEPSCEKTGKKVCSVCEDEKILDFLGHDFAGNSTTKVEGKDTSICNRCGEVEEVVVAQFNKVEAKKADYTANNLPQVADRMSKVDITSGSNNVITITQTAKFADKDDKKGHTNCIPVVLSLKDANGAIKASDVEVVGDNYEINPDDRTCASQWADSPADGSFIVWLLPSDFNADGTLTITFRDSSKNNSYPVTVTFKYVINIPAE